MAWGDAPAATPGSWIFRVAPTERSAMQNEEEAPPCAQTTKGGKPRREVSRCATYLVCIRELRSALEILSDGFIDGDRN